MGKDFIQSQIDRTLNDYEYLCHLVLTWYLVGLRSEKKIDKKQGIKTPNTFLVTPPPGL